MKHILRNSFIYLVSALGVTRLYQKRVSRKGPLVRVLVFHDVSDAAWFHSVIAFLASQYHLITPKDFQEKKFDAEKINVLITFDDGYQSWVDVCAPILKAHHAHALFFVSSGLLECAHDARASANYMTERLHVRPKKALTFEGVQRLHTEGHTLGGHTVNHPNLALCTNEEAWKEIVDNKEKMESMLGIQMTDFAYPFGRKIHRNEAVKALVLQAGYVNVYTADADFVTGSIDEIPRLCLEKKQPLRQIERWVEGGYDIFQYFNK